MGYPRDFRHVRRFCALDNDPLDLALGIFLETNLTSRYRDNERCMKRKRILNINPTVDSSPLESKLDEISFLALISKPKHLEKFSTGCMTILVKC